MFSTPMKSAGENVKDELITQNTLIGDIAQSLGLTVTEASGNSKNQLQIMNNNLQKIKNGNTNFLPENIKSGVTMWGKTGTFDNSNGQYIWKKYNEYEFIDYVVSDNENKYPDGAVHTDGYYYERIDNLFQGHDVFKTSLVFTSDTLIANIGTITHNLGKIPIMVLVISETNWNDIVAFSGIEHIICYNLSLINYSTTYSVALGLNNDLGKWASFPNAINPRIDWNATVNTITAKQAASSTHLKSGITYDVIVVG